VTGLEVPFAGLLLALACIAITGVYPGGIIVPSYLALFLADPARIGGTLAAAVVTLACYRLASRWLILFGRRRLVFLLLTGGIVSATALSLLPMLFPASLEFRVIGWVVPGLIAHHADRQGAVLTIAAAVTVTVATGMVGRLLALP
jgi:gamma-polyglutamate biosynthesis protein CapC